MLFSCVLDFKLQIFNLSLNFLNKYEKYSHSFFHNFLTWPFNILSSNSTSNLSENLNNSIGNFIKIDVLIIKNIDFDKIVLFHFLESI